MSESTNGLAHTSPSPNPLAAMKGMPGACQILYTSIDCSTDAGKNILARAVTGEITIIWDSLPALINVENVVMLQITSLDEETGEIVERPKLVVVDTDGKAWMTGSAPAISRLCRLISIFSELPWHGGKLIQFMKIKTRTGKECLTATLPEEGVVLPVPVSAKPKGERTRSG